MFETEFANPTARSVLDEAVCSTCGTEYYGRDALDKDGTCNPCNHAAMRAVAVTHFLGHIEDAFLCLVSGEWKDMVLSIQWGFSRLFHVGDYAPRGEFESAYGVGIWD